ncbi:ABC transporter ATP-binding protein [Cellulomonas fimi]|uniref:ABC transporter related protein n=1 Tax=Cellulomonas fimi (strain ATCC 484 / DSM 20113 / JCM 1341 / CCUG 24087 / LMG 16345 / NBRC 15513 / NCIMB 8980 / NCTC 7547 / NRS-133) TaxID=590998 RepID=F4H361_CELFA|nr:ABC transporter ATP-binding protein [Cellulomonas fimi]AEE45282.1 ABC transporter related protein [Cellulomonas fimi ATCC 484]NNH08027.1 ABC transporter ATP-binding protein [Cellulomonas fimi]VEH28802.1 Lipoprotein-releasing system ATP-binding protein LolD [Cellulomonas fimi]
MSLLELADVTRSVRLPDDSLLHILRGVTLDVDAGEHVAIVGRSGTGKSTLLNILGLLDAPTSGQYLLEGTPVQRLSNRTRTVRRGRDFGFVFQQFNLLPGRTALENVTAPLLYARGRQFWGRTRIAAAMLERVGLGDRLDTMPDKLSGGEQQRVAIARALVRGPRVILADEPTGALDVETGGEVMDLLDDIASQTGAALVTITHDLAVAARAERQYRLAEGVLVPITLDTASHWVGDVPTQVADRSAAVERRLLPTGTGAVDGPAGGASGTAEEVRA